MKKKLSFRISAKIGLGFGVLTAAIVIYAVLITRVINKSSVLDHKISMVCQPSENKLIELRDLVNSSRLFLKNYIFLGKISNSTSKQLLVQIQHEKFPALLKQLSILDDNWGEKDQLAFQEVVTVIHDSLFVNQQQIMDQLNTPEKYNDAALMAAITPLVLENGKIDVQANHILSSLDVLIQNQKTEADIVRGEMESQLSHLKSTILFITILLLIVSLVLAFLTIRSFVLPINTMKNILLSMSHGILPEKQVEDRTDEIGEMSIALNSLVSGLKATSNFALEIGRGNYNSEFKPLSKRDVLGNSLLRMRDDLKAAAEEEKKRKLEDEQRNWATAGVAKFSDILRKDNDKLDVLAYHIVSNLVDYLNANQGGLFVVGQDDYGKECLDLVASYAYNRQKFITKQLEINEGLVGRCAKEQETIYLTDIPDNYIRITSGLGDANPRCLLLVPMIMNDELFGVFELASFEEIQAYQVEFVEKIAETIASTLSTVRFNMQTAKLLEQSKIQAEELATREEEMRQNMEELRATQEQSARREVELQKTIEKLQKKI
jgi:hypothetical protein